MRGDAARCEDARLLDPLITRYWRAGTEKHGETRNIVRGPAREIGALNAAVFCQQGLMSRRQAADLFEPAGHVVVGGTSDGRQQGLGAARFDRSSDVGSLGDGYVDSGGRQRNRA